MKCLLALALLLASLAAHAQTCVSGAAGTAPSATLTFTAPTLNTDGSPIATPLTYTLFQGSSAATLTQAATGLTSSPIVVTTGLLDGSTYYWALTVKDAKGTSSAQSNVVCKSFPLGIPATVTITIT
jgi:hypothetical protein